MAGKKSLRGALVAGVLALTLGGGAATPPLEAASLDGAGRIVILPYAVSGTDRESTVYLTNPSTRFLRIDSQYVGAEGTPLASSKVGPRICLEQDLAPGETRQVSISILCGLATPDVENFGYLEMATHGGFDAAPFFVTSVVNTLNGDQFGVEGFPAGSFDPGYNPVFRTRTSRVIGLEGEVVGGSPIAKRANCYLATLGENKDVTVQLVDYGSGAAKPLGNPIPTKLPAWTMVELADVFARAGLAPGTYRGVSAEFYSALTGPLLGSDGATLIASCSVETVATHTEDFRMARTPDPRDNSRTRQTAHGDSAFSVGPFQIGYALPQGKKARMAVYLRHEDRVRCWLTPSTLRPQEDPTPWQELRVVDPDGVVVAGGDNVSDTGEFFTGVKNAVNGGENARWTVEVSWRETSPGVYPKVPVTPNIFGVSCEATSGISAMLPLDSPKDDF